MKIEEIKNILEENIKDFKHFHIGDFIEQPNQCGCIERKMVYI